MASQVDIVPALGHGVVSLQDPTIGWDAIDDRRRASVGKQEGAVEAGAYKVTPGALMTVNVAGDAGSFLVEGDSVAHQGLYVVAPVAAPLTLDVPASDPTLPRFDRIILEVKDANLDGSGLSVARVRYLTGTPTSGADLDTPSGAPTVPDTAALLADHVVPAGSSSVDAANIRDRRTWANGFLRSIERTTGDLGPVSTTNWVALLNAPIVVECSGAPVRMNLDAAGIAASTTGTVGLAYSIDGDLLGGNAGGRQKFVTLLTTAIENLSNEWVVTPAAGRHTLQPIVRMVSGNATIYSSTLNGPIRFTVEELVGRSNADNS